MEISSKTYRGTVHAMIYGIIQAGGDRPEGRDWALADALNAALDGDHERVLVEVANVLCPDPDEEG